LRERAAWCFEPWKICAHWSLVFSLLAVSGRDFIVNLALCEMFPNCDSRGLPTLRICDANQVAYDLMLSVGAVFPASARRGAPRQGKTCSSKFRGESCGNLPVKGHGAIAAEQFRGI
jgi:hypothetical protein